MEFLGHITRRDGLGNLVLTGKIEGRRERRRQRKAFLGSLKDYMGAGIRMCKVLHISRSREFWSIKVTNTARHGT